MGTTPRPEPEGAFPVFLEMGLGVDLVGEDSTKAARRAVREAIGRTSLPGVRDLIPSRDRRDMRVDVTVAVPAPETVDRDAVASEFPYGTVTVTPVEGGLRTPNGTDGGPGADTMICAVAVVAVGW
ncbi:Lin0512 family protein [Miltoncostaea oceani]|uniref:Lin0512 family protein n=1 Tax=Miltoncostaea oceani TaxID=2843216 RepID=UPI001C3E18A6|nr:Lin0512 family protein [Miltoncostaea oceani]